ncbi:MAG: hypothetical protein ACO3EY_03575 [Candidatus Nanopelagicales bacterium]
MATGFDVSLLSPYTDQLSQDLIIRAVLKPQSVQNLTVKPNLTAGTSAINILGAGVNVTDYSCGFTGATGNTTIFSQQNLVVATKQLKEEMCVEPLREYWISSVMSASAYANETPVFEEQIANLKVKEINKYIEQTIWAGDGSSLDGLISQTSVTDGAIDGTAFASDFAAATSAYDGFWGMVDALAAANPAVLQEDDLIMYVSYSTYSKLVQSLQAKGNSILLQYPNISNVSGSPENSFVFPGTNIKVFAAPGIVDLGSPAVPTVILGPKKYAFFGTGLNNDQDKFKFYYDPSQDNIKFLAAWRMGTAAIANQFISTVA